jgi:hypothetical protein
VWVSNGTAIELAEGWARAIEPYAETTELVAFLASREERGFPGCYGFHLDEDLFEAVTSRERLAHAMERLAHESVEMVLGRSSTIAPAWLATKEPYYQALWLSNQERVHALIRTTLVGTEPLAVAAPPDLRAAIDALSLWPQYLALVDARERGGVGADPVRELALSRERLALEDAAPNYFDRTGRRHARYHLAERLEALGRSGEAAAMWREIADLEDDASVRDVALAIADELACRGPA